MGHRNVTCIILKMVARAWKSIRSLDNNIVALPGWIKFNSAVDGDDNLQIVDKMTYGYKIANATDDTLGYMPATGGLLRLIFDEKWSWMSLRTMFFTQKQPDFDGTTSDYSRSANCMLIDNNLRDSRLIDLSICQLNDASDMVASKLVSNTLFITFLMQAQSKNIPFLRDGT